MKEVIRHNKDTATIKFQNTLGGFPGQFIMLNIYDYEEIPLSLSSFNSVTVKAIGATTKALIELKPGSLIGIKGPLGKGFTLPEGDSLLIAGGIGVAPLIFLNELFNARGLKTDFCFGARSSDDIVYECENIQITTDDGSRGIKGTVVDLINNKSERELTKYSKIYCCGPEIVLKKLFDIFKEYNLLKKTEFLIERYMKCGLGLCGSCTTGDGLMVCSEGPVFSGDQIKL